MKFNERLKNQQYEQGKYEPNIEKLIKLSDLFGITVDYLICHGE